MSPRLVLLPCLVALTACGSKVSSGRFTEQPLAPTSGPVMLFSTKLPTCAYDEIGIVHVKRRDGFSSMQSVIDAARKRARELGGHAIVKFGPVTGAADEMNAPALGGTVIRFKDANCST